MDYKHFKQFTFIKQTQLKSSRHSLVDRMHSILKHKIKTSPVTYNWKYIYKYNQYTFLVWKIHTKIPSQHWN